MAFSMSSLVQKVLEQPKWPDQWPYTDDDFARMDESPDAIFYDQPRLCYHIDDPCVAALTNAYSELLGDGEDVLDVCSSWVSHYPKNWKGGRVVGLGMNEYELSKNPQLTEFVVKDLNADPVLPFPDSSFDKVTCVVSIDYLNKPLQVVKEMGRVLRPRGRVIISCSNRCFPTKAFQVGGLTARIVCSCHIVESDRLCLVDITDLVANKRFGENIHRGLVLSLLRIV
jgi:SAM-dependent methyltransferase